MHLLAFAGIQLFPDGTIFIHVAMILVMIWVLNRTLYKPINRLLESREKNKGGNFSEAEEINAKVGQKEARYNKELLEARSEGYVLIEKEQAKSAAAREKTLAEVKAEVAEKIAAEKADLEKQTAAARSEIEKGAEKIADSIAAGILK
ncbi:MAG: hypothetical protein JO053_15435 [Acidobacteria bacterium]|nr:hypothetical protein [Acidobacteriota bacterium]